MAVRLFSFKHIATTCLTIGVLILGWLNVEQKRLFTLPEDGVGWIQSAQGVTARSVLEDSPAGRMGIQVGDTLHALSVPAFAWHWSMLPLLVIAAGFVARLAGLGWARNRIVMGAFCVVAVALSAMDIPKIFDMDLRVACLDYTVRYTTNVTPA